jgi:hypothetical protein
MRNWRKLSLRMIIIIRSLPELRKPVPRDRARRDIMRREVQQPLRCPARNREHAGAHSARDVRHLASTASASSTAAADDAAAGRYRTDLGALPLRELTDVTQGA